MQSRQPAGTSSCGGHNIERRRRYELLEIAIAIRALGESTEKVQIKLPPRVRDQQSRVALSRVESSRVDSESGFVDRRRTVKRSSRRLAAAAAGREDAPLRRNVSRTSEAFPVLELSFVLLPLVELCCSSPLLIVDVNGDHAHRTIRFPKGPELSSVASTLSVPDLPRVKRWRSRRCATNGSGATGPRRRRMSADWERTNRSEEGAPVIEYNGSRIRDSNRGGVVDDMEMSMVSLNKSSQVKSPFLRAIGVGATVETT